MENNTTYHLININNNNINVIVTLPKDVINKREIIKIVTDSVNKAINPIMKEIFEDYWKTGCTIRNAIGVGLDKFSKYDVRIKCNFKFNFKEFYVDENYYWFEEETIPAMEPYAVTRYTTKQYIFDKFYNVINKEGINIIDRIVDRILEKENSITSKGIRISSFNDLLE